MLWLAVSVGAISEALPRLSLFAKGLLLAMSLVVGGATVLGTVWFRLASSAGLAQAEAEAEADVEVAGAELDGFLERLSGNVRYLALHPPTQGFLAHRDDPALEAEWRDRLTTSFIAQLETLPELFQVRLLDMKGQELVRVERREAAVVVTPQDELQDKSRRGYFRGALGLEPGRVFVSALDLNVEQGKVETPWRPTVRIATVATDGAGLPAAVLVLNGAAEATLQRLHAGLRHPGREVYAIRQDGGFVLHPDPEQRFLPERGLSSMPLPWSVRPSPKVSTETLANEDRLSSLRVELGPQRWLDLVVVSRHDFLEQKVLQMVGPTALATLLVMGFGLLGAWVTSKTLSDPLARLQTVAKAVGAGQSTELPPELMRRDEVGELGRTMYAMAEAVRDREGKLHDARARLEAWLVASPVPMVSVNAEARLVGVNPAAAKLLDAEAEGLKGRRLETLLEGVEPASLPPQGPALAVRGKPIVASWAELEGSESEERFVGTLVDASSDAALQAALESSRLAAQVFAESSDLFVVTDAEARVLLANPEAQRRLGLTSGQKLPDVLPGLDEALEEDALLHHQGGVFQASQRTAHDLSFWQLVDVTELYEKTLALETSNEALSNFAYIASHDLQVPARHLLIYAQQLEEDHAERLGADGRRMLERMVRSAERMRGLVRGVLELARVDGSAKVEVGDVYVQAVANEVVEELRDVLASSGGAVRVEPGLGQVRMNSGHLRLLLANLIGNGLKFHRPGEAPHVVVRWVANEGKRARYQVEDDGIGIPSEYADSVFEAFQRLHGSAAYAGFGLGLALCQRVVARTGGDIRVLPRPAGEGACFEFTLPRVLH